MHYITENIGLIIAVLAIASAAVNSIVRLAVIFRLKLTFNCQYLVTEYVMMLAVLLGIFRRTMTNSRILAIFVIAMALWGAVTLAFHLKGFVFVRVFGIRHSMHGKISQSLADIAHSCGLDRTSMYIYGGDLKTACNMLIFKHTTAANRISCIKQGEKFLKNYITGNVATSILQILLNIAVVIMAYDMYLR